MAHPLSPQGGAFEPRTGQFREIEELSSAYDANYYICSFGDEGVRPASTLESTPENGNLMA